MSTTTIDHDASPKAYLKISRVAQIGHNVRSSLAWSQFRSVVESMARLLLGKVRAQIRVCKQWAVHPRGLPGANKGKTVQLWSVQDE
jgi:hypothetical protein